MTEAKPIEIDEKMEEASFEEIDRSSDGEIKIKLQETGDIAAVSRTLNENRCDYEINLKKKEVTATLQ